MEAAALLTEAEKQDLHKVQSITNRLGEEYSLSIAAAEYRVQDAGKKHISKLDSTGAAYRYNDDMLDEFMRLESVVAQMINVNFIKTGCIIDFAKKHTAIYSMKAVRQVWEVFMRGKEPEADTIQYYIKRCKALIIQ